MTPARGLAALMMLLATLVLVLVLVISVVAARQTPITRAQSVSVSVSGSQSESIEPVLALSGGRLAALPEARYDAVIAGLIPARHPAEAGTAYRLREDTALYAADRVTPVARLAARNFLGEPTVVVPVESSGEWRRILTPARQRLPSTGASPVEAADGPAGAPAQSSAWIRAEALVTPTKLAVGIVVSVSAQTLRIAGAGSRDRSWPVGVGAPGTPTPTGVTGYLQARYRDAAQGQAEHPVQLTSLHSTAADEPFGGDDGGLIGIHFQSSSSGAVSHGCIRVPVDALAAVDALPLGTLVTIQD